jgi:hypothetical protein
MTGDTEPAVAGCVGSADVALENVPPNAGGGGTALARVGTVPAGGGDAIGGLLEGAAAAGGTTAATGALALLVPAPGGAAMAALDAPFETELKPCACAKPNGSAAAASVSASRNGAKRA